MNEELKRLLEPGDDGRAFTAAVMLRASGALHRRRRAAEGAPAGALGWLERWARPWIVTALLVVAVAAAVLPLLPAEGAALDEPAEAQLLAAPQPEDMLVVSIGN